MAHKPMRTLKNAGIAGGTAVLLLSSVLVFAQGRPVNAEYGIRGQQAQNGRLGFGAAQAPSGTPSGNNISSTLRRGESGNVQRSVQALREQAQARVAQERERARQLVAEIRDKAKQQIAAHLAGQFDNINKVWTDHFAQLLDRYDAILQKIQNRANIAASDGKDVSAVNGKIQAAKTAIATARSAVEAQAAKTYTPDTSTAAPTAATSTPAGQQQLMQSLRTSFQTLRAQLFNDLFALRDGPMTDVRKAVQSALQTLGQIPGVDEGSSTSTKPERTSTNQ